MDPSASQTSAEMSEPTEATAAAEVPVEVAPSAPAAVEPPPTEPPATEEPAERPVETPIEEPIGEPATKVEEKEAEKADEAEGPPDPPPAAPAEEPAAEAAVAVKTEYKTLLPPCVDYGSDEGFFFRAKQCNNIRLLTTTPIPSFMQQNEEADGQMTAEEDQRVFELFQNVIRRQCHMKGMGLPTFTRHTLAKDDRGGLEGVFKQAVEDKRTSVIIILSAGYRDPYHMIVKALEQKYDIVTVHLLYDTAFKMLKAEPREAPVDEALEGEPDDDDVEEGVEQPKLECPADPDDFSEQEVLNWPNKIVRSIVRKLNCKLGGLCYRIVCDKESHARLAEDEMYLGVNLEYFDVQKKYGDLEEPKPFPVGETIVIMGYSANDLRERTAFSGDYMFAQKPFEHMVNAFQAILRETVARFRKNRGRDPSTVYVLATLHHAKSAYRLPERDMNKIRWFVNKDLECKALVHFVRVHQGEVQNSKLLADKPAAASVVQFNELSPHCCELEMISHYARQLHRQPAAIEPVPYRIFFLFHFDRPDRPSEEATGGVQINFKQPEKSGANAIQGSMRTFGQKPPFGEPPQGASPRGFGAAPQGSQPTGFGAGPQAGQPLGFGVKPASPPAEPAAEKADEPSVEKPKEPPAETNSTPKPSEEKSPDAQGESAPAITPSAPSTAPPPQVDENANTSEPRNPPTVVALKQPEASTEKKPLSAGMQFLRDQNHWGERPKPTPLHNRGFKLRDNDAKQAANGGQNAPSTSGLGATSGREAPARAFGAPPGGVTFGAPPGGARPFGAPPDGVVVPEPAFKIMAPRPERVPPPEPKPLDFRLQKGEEDEWSARELLPWKMFALSHCHQTVSQAGKCPAPITFSMNYTKRALMMLRVHLTSEICSKTPEEFFAFLKSITYADKKLRDHQFNA